MSQKLTRLLHKCTPSSGFFIQDPALQEWVSLSSVRTALVTYRNWKIKRTAHQPVDYDDYFFLNESCFNVLLVYRFSGTSLTIQQQPIALEGSRT